MTKRQSTNTNKPQTEELEMGEHLESVKNDITVSDIPLDAETLRLERKLKWKLDFYILPLISMVYFFSFMGRTDLGNANVAGLYKELKLTPTQYSTAATTFLVGYCIFQLPGTLLLRMIGPNWQFGGAMIAWGLFTTLSVLIHSAASLLALRFLIGAAEAFIQGAVLYLSFWYTYQELATRGAIFFSTASLASAFNGLISYGIAKNLNGKNRWLAWRWIFLIEGVMPMACSFLVFIFVPPTPDTARFGFSAEEKRLAVARGSRAHNEEGAKVEWRRILECMLDVHFWLMTVTACAGHYTISSLGNFLPDIILGLGYTSVNAQLMSVVVYACAFIGTLLFARIADKTNKRGATLAASSFVAALGYALLIGLKGMKPRLFATCVVAFGAYPNIVLNLSWLAMSMPGYTKRGASLAFINIFSQLFSIAGNHAYIDPPYFVKGNASSLGLSVLCGIVAILTSLYFKRQNAKKRREQFSEEASLLRQRSVHDIGHIHPDFFFTT